MARPIAPTPKLTKKAAKRFLEMVQEDLQKPVGPVPTPNADETIKLIMADANNRKK